MQLRELLNHVTTVTEAGDRIPQEDASYLLSYADSFYTHSPKPLLGVVALPWPRRDRGRWTRLAAFGRYRAAYSLIEALAAVLAPTVVRTGLVPVIVPFQDRD